jgi:hypothetical protein
MEASCYAICDVTSDPDLHTCYLACECCVVADHRHGVSVCDGEDSECAGMDGGRQRFSDHAAKHLMGSVVISLVDYLEKSSLSAQLIDEYASVLFIA